MEEHENIHFIEGGDESLAFGACGWRNETARLPPHLQLTLYLHLLPNKSAQLQTTVISFSLSFIPSRCSSKATVDCIEETNLHTQVPPQMYSGAQHIQCGCATKDISLLHSTSLLFSPALEPLVATGEKSHGHTFFLCPDDTSHCLS